jgi:hypothetical protein
MTDTRDAAHSLDPNHPLLSPGAESDHLATDIARDVALDVLDTMQREHGVTAEATEAAVRALLLAAAELRWDITLAGRGLLLSTMMMAGLDELRDDLVTPPTYDQAAQRARLTAAARAGWRAASTGEPLRIPAGGVELARAMLKACAPQHREQDGAPPAAA